MFCPTGAGSWTLCRIYIVDAVGDDVTPAAIELYDPIVADAFDEECGTFGSSEYAPADGKLVSCGSIQRVGGTILTSVGLSARLMVHFGCGSKFEAAVVH